MTQKEFVSKFSEVTGYTKVESTEIIERVLDLMVDSLAEDEPINFYGFGSFYTSILKTRKKWSPAANEYFMTEPRKAVRFKAGKTLLDVISGNSEEN